MEGGPGLSVTFFCDISTSIFLIGLEGCFFIDTLYIVLYNYKFPYIMISPFKELLIPNFAKVVIMPVRSGFRLVEGGPPRGWRWGEVGGMRGGEGIEISKVDGL